MSRVTPVGAGKLLAEEYNDGEEWGITGPGRGIVLASPVHVLTYSQSWA